MTRNKSVLLAGMMLSGTIAVPSMAQEAPQYRVKQIAIIDIDTDDDGTDEVFKPNPDIHGSIGLNNLGEIVYTRMVNGLLTAFIWLPNDNYGLLAGLHDLQVPAGVTGPSIARDINDVGIVVGQAGGIEPGEDSAVAVYWNLNTGTTAISLGQLETGRWSGAFAVTNDSTSTTIIGVGEIVGDCECREEVIDENNNEIDVAWHVTLATPLPPFSILNPTTVGDDNSQNSWVHGVSVLSSGAIRVVGEDFCGGREDQPGPFPKCLDTIFCTGFTDGLFWTIPTGTTSTLSKFTSGGDWHGRGVNEFDEVVGFGYNDNCKVRAMFWSSASASVCDLGAVMPVGHTGQPITSTGTQ